MPAGHCVSFVHAGLPHAPWTPPPPHVVPTAQVPHCRTVPQPSPAGPHVYMSDAHVAALHIGEPHVNATPPPPHVSVPGHVPHERRLPQLSGSEPQVAPSAAHVVGVHDPPPHLLGTPPPPHVCPAGQPPQSSVTPPQPSPCLPHAPGKSAQVLGVHVSTPHVPARAPGALLHTRPVQQSAPVVHVTPVLAHAAWQTSVPVESGVQGLPQQSADVAHFVPAGGGVTQPFTSRIRQRGMRCESRRQHSSGWLLHVPFLRPGGSQQLLLTLHESPPPTLHVWPAWLQALPLSQRP
jgi:hypothetical protein